MTAEKQVERGKSYTEMVLVTGAKQHHTCMCSHDNGLGFQFAHRHLEGQQSQSRQFSRPSKRHARCQIKLAKEKNVKIHGFVGEERGKCIWKQQKPFQPQTSCVLVSHACLCIDKNVLLLFKLHKHPYWLVYAGYAWRRQLTISCIQA